MSNTRSALKLLAEGKFICSTRYPEEFEALTSQEGRAIAEHWVEDIGYRLARLGPEGAYFMAYGIVTAELRSQVREDMRLVRGKLEPYIGWLETLRISQGQNPHLHEGDLVTEGDLTKDLPASPALAQRLMEMRDLASGQLKENVQNKARRMLDQLAAEGYLVLSNPTLRQFRVTGKITYLYQLLSFIAANSSVLADDSLVDQIDPQQRIDGDAGGQEAPEPAAQGGSTPHEGAP